jgi:hypothetical protein
MTRIDRRRLLKFSGAGAIAAGTGGIAAILASGRAARLRTGDIDPLAAVGRFRAGLG